MRDFGELRSLVHGAPSAGAFSALISMIREASAQDTRAWLPYALDHTRGWNERVCSFRVPNQAPWGPDPPAWLELVKTLDLGHAIRSEVFLERLVSSPVVRNLQALSYAPTVAPAGLLEWVVNSEHLLALERLRFRSLRGSRVAATMEGLGRMGLVTLSMSECDIGCEGLAAFSRGASATLRELELSACGVGDDGLCAFARSPSSSAVRRLELFGNAIGEAGISEFARRDGVPIRTLDLSMSPIMDEGAIAIADSPRFRSLRGLRLDGCGLADDGVIALAERGALRELRMLELRRNSISDRGALALARADTPRLYDLAVERNMIGASGAIALLRASTKPALSQIDFDGNDLGGDSFDAPEDSSSRGALEHVYVTECGAGPGFVAALAATRALGSVTGLRLCGSSMGVVGARALGESLETESLETFDVDSCNLSDEEFALLLPPNVGERMAAVDELDLTNNALTDASADVLPNAGLMALEILFVSQNAVGSAWLAALAASPSSAPIEDLYLSDTRVGDGGLEALADSPHFDALKTLDVSQSRVTERGLGALFRGAVFARITSLETSVDVSDDGVLDLLAAPNAASLTSLALGVVSARPQTWRALATSEHLSGLNRFVFTNDEDALGHALAALRAEGARLNPWTKNYGGSRE